MKKCISDKCDSCNVPENVEHVILWCNKYSAERISLHDKIYGLERGWITTFTFEVKYENKVKC